MTRGRSPKVKDKEWARPMSLGVGSHHPAARGVRRPFPHDGRRRIWYKLRSGFYRSGDA
jgi:hypothetical protein